MIIKADPETCFVFDLDDTLYHEIDFLRSAYRAIAKIIDPGSHNQLFKEMIKTYSLGGNTFNYLIERYPNKNINGENLLYLYRNHVPTISLREGVLEILMKIKSKQGIIGIITNGRSITQRNKIRALGLEKFIDEIVISEEFGCEKPDYSLYEYFLMKNNFTKFIFFGDNPEIDFIAPRKMNWYCIGILDKKNIHKQNISDFSNEFLPQIFIKSFNEIEII